MRPLTVHDDPAGWFAFAGEEDAPLDSLQTVLMRKDPPLDMEYIFTTQILARAEQAGVLVVNRTQSIRDVNEKLYTAWFAQCCVPMLVSRNAAQLRRFIGAQRSVILKPLDGMGGASVFKIDAGDLNTNVIIETLTAHGARFAMAQRYIPEVAQGDKRILMIDGEPVPYALARIPAAGEARANLAAGGRGEGIALSERDRRIANEIGPVLREKGLLFVGLDVIGDYLTEINVTSPTCIRELDRQYGLDIAGQLMDVIAAKLGG
jgi:glutathione synthase